MPLAGHLLLILVRGFAFGGAIELQDGVDTNFPDSLGEGSLLCADGEFALVFVAAEFALDGYMGGPSGLRGSPWNSRAPISPRGN